MIVTYEEKEKIYHCLLDIIDNTEMIGNNIDITNSTKYIIKEVETIAHILGVSLD